MGKSIEVKEVKAKNDEVKPISNREKLDEYGLESGSMASQVIHWILECNRKNIPVTMNKDVRSKFGNSYYSVFKRLEEIGLAHREGKFLYVHPISETAQRIIEVVKTHQNRVGANNYYKETTLQEIAKVVNGRSQKKNIRKSSKKSSKSSKK